MISGLVREYTLMQSRLGAIRMLIDKMLLGWRMVRIVVRQLCRKAQKLAINKISDEEKCPGLGPGIHGRLQENGKKLPI